MARDTLDEWDVTDELQSVAKSVMAADANASTVEARAVPNTPQVCRQMLLR
jgi:hypothetical protein